MAKNEHIFKRYEYKYLLTLLQYRQLMDKLEKHITADEYKESTILSLYYDTKEKTLIRRSLEQPAYKEKLRLRSYGVAGEDTRVYVELKKKYDGIVYKRRVGMTSSEAESYLETHECGRKNQITEEIDYFMKHYGSIEPSMMLTYNRSAYVARDDENLRITFDSDILYREKDLSVKHPIYGYEVIPRDMILLELKVAEAIPLWLTEILSELRIYKTSFSKYGTAYKLSQERKIERLNTEATGSANRKEKICS